MHKSFIYRILGALTLALLTVPASQAFSLSHYATESRLSSGRWVKIAVPEDGVYELTSSELMEMGFSDPSAVRIYGAGGHMISEVMDGSAMDDLQPVPSEVIDGKLCFYGLGPVSFTMAYPRKADSRHYSRIINTYSTKGYYFLTDDNSEMKPITKITPHGSATGIVCDRSFNKFYHEAELLSLSQTGKDLLGEEMEKGTLTINYSMPGLIPNDTVMVNVCAAAMMNETAGYIQATLNGTDRAPFRQTDAIIYILASSEVHYNTKSPYAIVVPTVHNENGTLTTYISQSSGSIKGAYLDYVIMTYRRLNDMAYATDGQFGMGVPDLHSNDEVVIKGADAATVVWNVTNPKAPTSMTLNVDENGDYRFMSDTEYADAEYVAFNPSTTLRKIDSWEEVENQNLHGMATPDLLVITNKNLLPQAERLAQLHRDHDGIDVLVVTQEQVFNEFSSGTPDAMAFRMLSKMLYDRDKNKFRNLLLFGGGSYDNRNLLSDRKFNILTYQSDRSDDEELSYVSDDFFAMLDDNSGYNVAATPMRIGVGRITSQSLEEAETDVNKIEDYVLHPDFGVWRNNALYTCDADDQNEGLHTFQAEGVCNLVTDDLDTHLAENKVYVSQYPRGKIPGVEAQRQHATDGHTALINRLNEGQYFMTYVGHAGITYFTKLAQLWSATDAANVQNPHLPIMTTACCDVARYDSDQRGIAEIMFHNPKGGAIAMLTSTRAVYAEYNDSLNRAWCRAMFSFEKNGYMPTLGEVVMKSKAVFGSSTNRNKMSFLLLGDPAIRVNYPKPYFRVTSVNGTAATDDADITLAQMQQVEIKATVYKADKTTIDSDFTGDAYATIYGEKRYQTQYTMKLNGYNVTRPIYYPREILAQVKGRVVNGQFTASVILPNSYALNDSIDAQASIRVYAHKDNTEEMVNGRYDNAKLGAYNPETAVVDNEPPKVTTMYFNNAADFEASPVIESNAMLYITATDDMAFNTQGGVPSGQMKLVLDNGLKTYSVRDFAEIGDEGKSLAIVFPMSALEAGHHELQYTVFDAAGNVATRTIAFTVEQPNLEATMTVAERPAVEEATFTISGQSFDENVSVYLKVIDAVGNVVYSTVKTGETTFTWNLKGNDGKRVKAGLYRFYAAFESGLSTGGTAVGTLIVVDPIK